MSEWQILSEEEEGRRRRQKVQPSPHLEKSSSTTQQIPKPSMDPPPPQVFHRPGSPLPPGNSPGPQDRLGSPGMQKQPPMCAPSSPGWGPWEHQPEEHWEETASQPCPSSRLLPGTRGTKSCSKHNAAFDILAAAAGPGRMGGAAQPSGPIVLALSGLWLGSRAPPCLSADCFMPIRLWHIPHILGLRYTVWFLWGWTVRGSGMGGGGREHLRNQGCFCSCSLPAWPGPHGFSCCWESTPHPVSLCKHPTLAIWVKLELRVRHFTSAPALAAKIRRSEGIQEIARCSPTSYRWEDAGPSKYVKATNMHTKWVTPDQTLFHLV